MSDPIVTWRGGPTAYDARYEGLILLVEADGEGWRLMVERVSDGAIMAVEVGFDEIADAKGRAVYLPWEMGLVD